MNYKEILENEFGSIIIDAKLVKNEFGNTLEIITSFNNLSDVENISKKISVFLDSQNDLRMIIT
ncbi:hypothetical protein NW731_06450 [Mycoplasmopsis felis]|uniref:hypothetical protein n=1 Tax=Mycoplasmopsis felis TaxID=33923 RepID=UPI0021E07023|nr:hypothetical protein [Mycoplasmopsis felis]MCU9938009.1 hypothetical protein [Mycoplasmopsis felis]